MNWKTFTTTLLLAAAPFGVRADVTLFNVSYDPTRELYQDINTRFAKQWEAKTKEKVTIRQSHGGSGKQARSVIDGLDADVVTLALAYDIDEIANRGRLLPATGRSACRTTARRTRRRSCSSCARAIRRTSATGTTSRGPACGHHAEPEDLRRRALELPRRLGLGAAKFGGDEAKVQDFVARVFRNVPVLDSGARGSTTTFVERGIGDVLLAWENEAFLAREANSARTSSRSSCPRSRSSRSRPSRSSTRSSTASGTRKRREAYLDYLYTDEARTSSAQALLPPDEPEGRREVRAAVPQGDARDDRRRVRRLAEGAEAAHFADGGFFDRIYGAGR
jgi:ABC-type sulfate transport system substrate-binding protein